MKKCSVRHKHCACAGCSKVQTQINTQTHRQDRLQYTAQV